MSAPLQPDERVVVRYAGAQIIDAREKLRVRFDAKPNTCAEYMLRHFGFRRLGNHRAFEAPNTPISIMRAQEVCREWHGPEIAP